MSLAITFSFGFSSFSSIASCILGILHEGPQRTRFRMGILYGLLSLVFLAMDHYYEKFIKNQVPPIFPTVMCCIVWSGFFYVF